jgi:hypothetical protein
MGLVNPSLYVTLLCQGYRVKLVLRRAMKIIKPAFKYFSMVLSLHLAPTIEQTLLRIAQKRLI